MGHVDHCHLFFHLSVYQQYFWSNSQRREREKHLPHCHHIKNKLQSAAAEQRHSIDVQDFFSFIARRKKWRRWNEEIGVGSVD